MRATIVTSNPIFPHLIVDDWFDEQEYKQVWSELNFYLANKKNLVRSEDTPEVAYVDNKPIGHNARCYPDLIFAEDQRKYSHIMTLVDKFRTEWFHDLGKQTFENGQFNSFTSSNRDTTMISYYESGDRYHTHFDTCAFTSLIWLHKKPKGYSGGDFYIDKPKIKIDCKDNRMVLFPSWYDHSVTPVTMNTNEPNHGRITITHFFNNNS
jgi:Rps23 Pro-64 3,4-dihydroxylase Tpa1-like proline 4-hydroxylase